MPRSKPPVTAFKEFLRLNARSVTRFAAEHGLVTRLESVYWLCEPGTQAKQPSSVTFEVLHIVSEATGISPGTLIDDAMAVWRQINGKDERIERGQQQYGT